MTAIKQTSLPPQQALCDSHVHTRFCGHARGEMEDYVEAAIKKGLKKITFLEHMEEGISRHSKTWLSEEEFDEYFFIGAHLKEKYRQTIEVKLGVECGFNPECKEALVKRLEKRSWDQIGISCHFLKLKDRDYHLNLFSRRGEDIHLARQTGPEKILNLYYAMLLEAVEYLPGTVLCHLDGALRHLPEIHFTESHRTQIETLLQAAKKRGMAVELNSSGFDIRQKQFPADTIVEMVKRYNIPMVFSSDAHIPKDVGRYFDVLATLIP